MCLERWDRGLGQLCTQTQPVVNDDCLSGQMVKMSALSAGVPSGQVVPLK